MKPDNPHFPARLNLGIETESPDWFLIRDSGFGFLKVSKHCQITMENYTYNHTLKTSFIKFITLHTLKFLKLRLLHFTAPGGNAEIAFTFFIQFY